MFARRNIHEQARAAVIGAAVVMTASAWATELPDAGATLKQLQDLRGMQPAPAMPAATGVVGRSEPSVGSETSGPKVWVKSIRMDGNKSLSQTRLEQIVQPWTGGEFTFQELAKALDAVTMAYRESGRAARVYFPQQDVTDGEIRIEIVESVMGQIRLLDQSHRLDKGWFLAYARRHLPERGEGVLIPEVERVVRVANEIPGVSVSGNLAAGQQEGETDLALSVEDRPLFSGLVMADNAGQKSSGSQRAIAVISGNGLTGKGDEFSLTLLKTQGVDYAKMDIWLTDPWISGLRLGWLGSHMRYSVVSGDQVVNEPGGTARSIGVQAAYAIARTHDAQSNWKFSLEHKSLFNRNAAGPLSDYGITVMNQQVVGYFHDGGHAKAVNSYVLSMSAGRVALAGSPNQDDDQRTARTEGGFSKWAYGLTRQQYLGARWNLTTAFSGQWSRQNLDSSEKFYIGGPTSVRAYPASEAGGSRGYQFNIDLNHQWDGDKTLGVFYDYGRVTVAADPWDEALNKIDLHGYGVSAQWRVLPKTRVKALVSWRTGRNPNPTGNGMDQDGTLKSPRVWLEAVHTF